jgi:hypothetical protein
VLTNILGKGVKMKIWRLTVNWGNSIMFVNRENVPEDFNGEFIEDWGDVYIKFKNQKKFDSIDFGPGKFAFSKKAVEVLKPLINEHVQILPLKHEKLDYYLINVTNLIEGIDFEKSILDTLDNGRILGVDEYVFKENAVKEVPIFKEPYFAGSHIYVSDLFRQTVIENKLTGFEFIELWDSELPRYSELPEPIEWQDPLDSETFTFDMAMKNAKDTGITFRSGKWRLRYNQNEDLEIGEVNKKGETKYHVLVYIPPILLTQNWYIGT